MVQIHPSPDELNRIAPPTARRNQDWRVEAAMTAAREFVTRFLQDEQGVTAIEYALIASLIVLVIIVSVGLLGTSVTNLYNQIETQLAAALG
ncbi:Flp family type IVb pilin [Trinickia sp. YCB016]